MTFSHANTRTPGGQLDSLRGHLMYITSGYTVCPKRMTNDVKSTIYDRTRLTSQESSRVLKYYVSGRVDCASAHE